MITSYLRIVVVLLFIFVATKSYEQQVSIVRIYSYLAEVIQPITQLPLEFTTEDWNSIRWDSITLIGKNLHVTSQSIREQRKSLKGVHVYVRAPIFDDKSARMFVKATLADETGTLVKIEDPAIWGKEAIYFHVLPQDILYLEKPSESKIYVDFTYTPSDSAAYVSYLRTNLKWETRYQLNLHHDESSFIAMANIRNDGNSSLLIDKAELFAGETNLRWQNQQNSPYYYYPSSYSSSVPIEASIGTHILTIDKPFTINGQTDYLVPMFQPQVAVERYNSISTAFKEGSAPGGSSITTGTAQSSYRLKSDRYLSKGNCIVRESNRIVGENLISSVAGKDEYEFSIGQDSEVTYVENVTYVSSEGFQAAWPTNSTMTSYRTRYIYNIDVQVKNVKTHSIKIQYGRLFHNDYNSYSEIFKLELKESTDNICTRENFSIKCQLTLNAGGEYTYSYTAYFIR